MPGKAARLTKWQPKEWRPEYERAVAYSAMGVSNKEIARRLGFTPEHVSNILNLDKSKERMAEFIERLKVNNDVDVTQLAVNVTAKTLSRLNNLLDDDEKFKESPFSIIDRGLRVGDMMMKKATPETSPAGVNVTVMNGQGGSSSMVIAPSAEMNLLEAMKRAQTVKSLPPIQVDGDKTNAA